MQQGRFRATGMMNHHPYTLRNSSVAILVTGKVGHFWIAYPGQSSKAPKVRLRVPAERKCRIALPQGCLRRFGVNLLFRRQEAGQAVAELVVRCYIAGRASMVCLDSLTG